MTPRGAPTDEQLRDAYHRARLGTIGITYEQAMQDPALRGCLQTMANSDRRWAATVLGHGSRRLEHLSKDSQ